MRPKKIKIKLNDNSLTGVMQEVYNNACVQINDAQKVINEVSASVVTDDIDDITKIAKAKTDALKVKDSAIKIKLDLGKLQSEVIKNNGKIEDAIENNPEIADGEAFEKIRKLIEEKNKKNE